MQSGEYEHHEIHFLHYEYHDTRYAIQADTEMLMMRWEKRRANLSFNVVELEMK